MDLGDRGVDVWEDEGEPVRVPLAPIPFSQPVGGAVAVGDEAAVGQLPARLVSARQAAFDPLKAPRSS